MKHSMIPRIEHAVLLALAACGTATATQDGGEDAAPSDATLDTTAPDATDDGALDATDEADADAGTVAYLPLPDGCAVNGKPDGFAPCGYTETLNDPTACQVDVDADTQDSDVCYVLCSPDEPDCVYYDLGVGDGGHEYLLSCGAGCVGRLHESARDELGGRCARARFDRGAWLADGAALEAASVAAFEILAGELARFGAPRALVADAKRAARDEVRHARATAALAERFGASPASAPAPAPAPRERDLRTFAIENAIEGCVRETFGAALAAWQASRARDHAVREAMRAIARDEARHADLGWRIDAWLTSSASAGDARAMREARAAAVSALLASADEWGAGDAALGLPTAAEAARLLATLDETIWHTAGVARAARSAKAPRPQSA